jgi:hypothetical protein
VRRQSGQAALGRKKREIIISIHPVESDSILYLGTRCHNFYYS